MPVSLHLSSALGEHNVQILREVAGLRDPEIQQLAEAGIIHAKPRHAAKPVSGATGSQVREREGLADADYQEAVRRLVEGQ
jgi:hypothetical protein